MVYMCAFDEVWCWFARDTCFPLLRITKKMPPAHDNHRCSRLASLKRRLTGKTAASSALQGRASGDPARPILPNIVSSDDGTEKWLNRVEDGHIGKGETEKEAKKRKLREQRIARAKRRRITKALEEITGDKSLAERVCLLPELKSSIMAMLGYLKTPILASKSMMFPLRHVLIDNEAPRDLDLLRNQKFPKNLEKVTLLKFTRMPRRRFPQDLKVLYIHCRFKGKLGQLPRQLEELYLWAAVLKLPLHLPRRLKELTICSCGFTPLELPELPETLKVLRVMCMNFNQKLKLPMNLEELVIRSVNFNQQLRLPERLKSLRIYSDNFKQPLEFPESLEKRQILRPFTYLW